MSTSSTDSATMPPASSIENEERAGAKAARTGEAASADWAERCANCEARLHGRYCHDCGEKVVGPEDYALSGFLHRALATLTHLDGSVFRTYYYLFAKPGFLTQEHRAGRRKRYLRPLQVFIIANVVFYLFSVWTGANMLQTPLGAHLHKLASPLHAELAGRLVSQHLQETGMGIGEYAGQFNDRIAPLSKTLVVAIIPMFALLLKAVHARRKRYYVEHLVFAAHTCAYWLLTVILLGVLLQVILPSVISSVTGHPWIFGSGLLLTIAMIALMTGYFSCALRRRFRMPWWLAFSESVVLTVGFTVAFMLYRTLLFFVAFYATT